MKSAFKSIIVAVLTFEARLLLRRARPTIIAVTGSVGKTATKDAIYEVIKTTHRARKSEKSFNSELGVPLTVLGLPNAWHSPVGWLKNLVDGLLTALHPGQYPDVLVLEMGVDRPGDMAKHTKWIIPDVVVLTRLPDVPTHVEYFSSPEAVVAEKLTLVSALRTDGHVVYNHDDEKVRTAAAAVRQPTLGYGRYAPTDFYVTQDEVTYTAGLPTGMEFKVTHGEGSALLSVQGSIGVQHAYNYAAALAVAHIFSIPLADAAAALSAHVPPPGRMRVVRGIKDTVIIDDTYNSSPIATERALSSLLEIKTAKRRIAVLGDMLELGRYSVGAHERVGAQVAETADVLVAVGVRARKIVEGALEHGMSEKHIYQYDNAAAAGRELQNLLVPGDVVLVKGSQGMRCEQIVHEIMREPERAAELLVRQGPAWQKEA
jgi:UDP-N-acetylmuramoyl-tripeptide--D-alanyl-D-alanine ligase